MPDSSATGGRRFHAAALVLVVLTSGGCAKQTPEQRWVHKVTLHGNRTLGRSDILDGLATAQTGWWPFATKQWFEAAAFERDSARIEALYAAHGFFDAHVVRHEVRQRDDRRSVDVAFEVSEGPTTTVRTVAIDGVDHLSTRERQTLAQDLGVEVGRRFVHSQYRDAKQRLLQRLTGRGYAYAAVEGTVRVDRQQHSAEVRLVARTGPFVRFGDPRIEGNGDVPADKIARLVTFHAGDPFSEEELRRSKARLHNQRLFSTVNLKIPKQPTAVAPVRVVLTPSKRHELRLGLGIGIEKARHEVRLSGRWTIRNFLGGMRTLELQIKPAFVALPTAWSAKRMGAAIESEGRLTQPDLWRTRITAFGALGYDLGIHEGYQYHGPRLQAGLERSFLDEVLRVGVSWNFQFYLFFNIAEEAFDPLTTPLGLGFKDIYRLAFLEEFVKLDLRDAIVDARAGFYAEVRFEQGLPYVGGDFTYLKVVPEARGYVPIGTRRLVLALRAQLGYLWPRGDGDSPATRRLVLGGPNSHRGFTFGRLSPQSLQTSGERIPLGGNASLLGSADLRLRVVQLLGSWLCLTGFFDAGDATVSFSDLSPSQLHLAVGGTLSYQTPLGAIAFGIGVRLNRLSEKQPDGRENPDPGSRPIDRLAFHITLGEAF
jgi:translocation and assembly module TamA